MDKHLKLIRFLKGILVLSSRWMDRSHRILTLMHVLSCQQAGFCNTVAA